MSRTPHDALFKAAFETPAHTAALCSVAFPGSVHAAVAWSTLAPRRSTLVDARLVQHHNDLLFTAEFRALEGDTLILLEHQSCVDRTMSRRLHHYISRIWSAWEGPGLPPVLALVLSHDEAGWHAPTSVQDLVVPRPDLIPGLSDLLPSFRVRVVDLHGLSNDDLLGWPLPPFPKLTLWLFRDARCAPRLLANFHDWAPLFSEALAQPGGAHAVSQLFHYILRVAGAEVFDELRAKVSTHLSPTHRGTMTTIAESLINKGRREGQRQLLESLLELRFGPLESRLLERLANVDEAELTRIGKALLTAPSLSALLERVVPEPG